MKENLFDEFSPISKADWIQQIIKDLKGKDFEKTVISRTKDDLRISPFYNHEDADDTFWLKEFRHLVNPSSGIPEFPPRIWSNVFVSDASDEQHRNKEILQALQNGADALRLYLSGDEDFDILLREVELQYIQLFVCPKGDPILVLKQLFSWLEKKQIDPNHLNGGILWDGFTRLLIKKSDKDKVIQQARILMHQASCFPNFKTFAIDSAHYHNSGASTVQELSFALAGFIELMDGLTSAGLPPEEIIGKTMIWTATGSDYFLEIAKVKSMRILFHQLAGLYGFGLALMDIFIYSETSFWTKTKMDIHSNMIRNTVESMAAVLGGCNALQVIPHDIANNEGNSFSKRMALNISNIIKEECYFDKVLDPAAGSYFLENMINQLFDAVQIQLENIESQGGWWNLYQRGEIQKQVKEKRALSMDSILSQEKSKIGVNKYLINEEMSGEQITKPIEEGNFQLLPMRESMSVENLKNHEA
jgi:methylmalonyl-CoA mutase